MGRFFCSAGPLPPMIGLGQPLHDVAVDANMTEDVATGGTKGQFLVRLRVTIRERETS